MSKPVVSISCGLVAALLLSCTERIDIRTDDAAPRLVVYGKISTDTMAHTVSITRSTGYFAAGKPEGVSDAEVKIFDDAGGEYLLFYQGDGNYRTHPGFSGVEGRTYRLEVTCDGDGDGVRETFEASSWLPIKGKVDGLRIVPSAIFRDALEIQLSADLPEKRNGIPNAYNIHFYQENKALNDSLKNFTIFDDEYIITQRLDTLACYYIFADDENIKLQPGDKIRVRVDVITKEYADFLTEAQQEMRGSVPLFSGPPADVRTNIRCRVKNISAAGFFTAFSFDEMDTVYK
jgi:hypothetical protein